MSKYLGGSPPIKPPQWAVDPGRVHKDWKWFYNALVAAWPMWEGGGTILYGIVGGGADVDAISTGGTFPAWAEGQVGKILTFAQGSSEDIILPLGLSIANLQAHSIVSFWRTAGTTAMTIYGEGDSASTNSALVYAIRGDQAENYINYFNRDSGGTNNVQFNSNGSGNDYADGNWHLGVAALRSKSATDMTHWVDGVDVTQTDLSSGTPGSTTINQVRIGTFPRTTAVEYFDEDLAFVATFNRALTQAEAQQLTVDPWGWLTPVDRTIDGCASLPAPTGVTEVSVGPNNINASFTDNTGGQESHHALIRVQGATPWDNPGDVPAGITTYEFTGLTTGTIYEYTFQAFRSSSSCYDSPIAAFQTSTTHFSVTVSGVLSTSGALARSTEKTFGGTASSAGAIAKDVSVTFEGTFTSTGAYGPTTVTKPLVGTLTSAGSLLKQVASSKFTGSVSPAGVLTVSKIFVIALAGALSPSGALIKKMESTIGGTLTASGVTTKQVLTAFAGAVTPSGSLVKDVQKTLAGALSLGGTVIKLVSLVGLSGVITMSSTLSKLISTAFAGVLTFIGALINLVVPGGGRLEPVTLEIRSVPVTVALQSAPGLVGARNSIATLTIRG